MLLFVSIESSFRMQMFAKRFFDNRVFKSLSVAYALAERFFRIYVLNFAFAALMFARRLKANLVSARLSSAYLGVNRLRGSGGFNLLCMVTLVVCVACALVNAYLMWLLDALIHVRLYDFGLQFNPAWADVYYTYAHAFYAVVAVPVVFSLITLAVGLKIRLSRSSGQVQKSEQKQVQPQQQVQNPTAEESKSAQVEPLICGESTAAQQQQSAVSLPATKCEVKTEIAEKAEAAGMLCPSCGKRFSRALLMLNFEGGKSRLVQVCPYCSFTLGCAGPEQQGQCGFEIADSAEKLA